MAAPTCYACDEELSPNERYDVVLLAGKSAVVCAERDRAHEIVRAA